METNNNIKKESIFGPKGVIGILGISLILLIILSFVFGRYHISIKELWLYVISRITGKDQGLDENIYLIIGNIRFPRIALGVLLGAALSVSGASYQGIFKNPMVSPDILGASAGAGFGACLGILLSFSNFMIQICAFLFGILAVSFSHTIGRVIGRRDNTTLVLVLSGMVISSLFNSFIAISKYVADPYSKLPEITFWMMGSLSSVTNRDVLMVFVQVTICTVILMLVRWRLNVLSFGDEEAAALGVNTKRIRLLVIVCATVLTTSVVSVSGQIGWVGLVIPHLGRMLVGPDYKYLMPCVFLLGACYLLIVDNFARNMFQMEIPLGILTAIIGAPFFVYLLLKGKKGWV